jgi:hypothetical protein
MIQAGGAFADKKRCARAVRDITERDSGIEVEDTVVMVARLPRHTQVVGQRYLKVLGLQMPAGAAIGRTDEDGQRSQKPGVRSVGWGRGDEIAFALVIPLRLLPESDLFQVGK